MKNNNAYSNLSSMNTTHQNGENDSFHTQEHQAPPFSPERTDNGSNKYKKSDMTAHGGLGKSLVVAN